MESKVYFIPTDQGDYKAMSIAGKKLLETIIKEENVVLEKKIPLKVHFGEEGNNTYIRPWAYDGIIDLLEENQIKGSFIETNAMYSGQRMKKNDHLKLAGEHGFKRLPVIIADGDRGEDFYEVEINKKHFKQCKLGKAFSNYKQVIVLSHFKGHMLAGFGGAIKQLAMGFASRGGKLAQHLDAKPFIIPFLCKKCNACVRQCPVDAITIGGFSKIDHSKCIGCAACTAVCPANAIQLNMFKFLGNMGSKFQEKIVEYAYAGHKNKKNIYISFAASITKGCDCEGHNMEPIIDDIGVFASLDPVALDMACYDMAEKAGKRFGGKPQLWYAESVGLGTINYKLQALKMPHQSFNRETRS